MKQKYLLIFAVTLALLAQPVFAQDFTATPTPSRTFVPPKPRVEIKERIYEKREEFRTRVDAYKSTSTPLRPGSGQVGTSTRRMMPPQKASTTAARVEMQQNLAKRKVDHVAKVLSATVERLENMILRIESRITKIKASGGNTSASESAISLAKVNLSDAKAKIAELTSLDLSAEKAQENFAKVREAARLSKEHIREAHRNMKEAVKNLKGFERPAGTATSTATSTSQ